MEIGLDDGAVLGIDGKEERFTVRCLAGGLYLTRTGDSRDYFLAAGEEMAFTPRDYVVVEALGATRLQCKTPAAFRPLHRRAEVWHLAGSA